MSNRIVIPLLLATSILAPATAQTIQWGPVLPTLAPSDVSLNGTLMVARNLHSAGAAQTPVVNGVTFTGNFAPSGWTNASTVALNSSTTGDTAYDLMLNSARATSGTTGNPTGWGAIRLDTIATLTAGRSYEIQCWFTDQRLGTGTAALYDRAMTLSSALGAATLVGGDVSNLASLVQGPLSAPLDGDPDNAPATTTPDAVFGSHCIGTFTRTDTTTPLWLLVQGSHPVAANSLRPHLTAFQIRELTGPQWLTYGAGCANPVGVSALQLVSLPAIGGTFALDVTNVGPGFLFMLTGTSQLNLPLPLPEFVPGCTALATPDLVDFVPTVGSSASWSLAIPNNPTFAGIQLFNQALEFGALWSLSNGGQATLF
ncbi:MAG: hypothetical protein MUC36_03935 [Planctomycetes bacterium]|jgi:hypothetical protein|nr:hypothetical protein [Planctomycetota bacterium]